MRRMVALTAAASVLLLLGGCGGDNQVSGAASPGSASNSPTPPVPGGAGSSASPTDPSGPAGGPGGPPPSPGAPEHVSPRPGMTNLRPVRFESAEALDQRTVRITFYGGVEPCDVLDSVKVAYHTSDVTISLFSGADPAKPDAMCIQIAKLKVTDVRLTEDLGDREIKDGAPPAGVKSTSQTPAAGGKLPGDTTAVAVTPKPGQANVHAISWNRYELVDPTTVRIYFVSGVAPCSVLDHVQVTYAQEIIRVALFSGSDPAHQGEACPMLARTVYTDVHLSQPVGNRDVVDDTQTD